MYSVGFNFQSLSSSDFFIYINFNNMEVVMTNIRFIKTLTAGVVLALAISPQVWAVVQTGTDCDGK